MAATETKAEVEVPSKPNDEPALGRRARLGFGISNVGVALFALVGVFRLLPTRWWVVDGGGAVVALLLGASGALLLARHRRAADVTRVAAGVVLVLGLALVAALVLTTSWISGVYSQVGKSGAILFGLVAALVLPYAVVLPAAELLWLGPRVRRARRDDASGPGPAGAAPEPSDEARPQASPAKKAGRSKASKKKGR